MKRDEPITLKRDCDAVMIPSGEKVRLSAGSAVWVTQSLGGSYTVMTDKGYVVRIAGGDADALGMAHGEAGKQASAAAPRNAAEVEARLWEQLKSCFDPEIPVNIVELGLIYRCRARPLAAGGYCAEIRFTLTARGCGMGEALKGDIERKLLAVADIREVSVDLVWDPPWNQSMISEAAKQELGIS